MSEVKIISLPSVHIKKATKKKLLSKVQEEAQVIVHCKYTGTFAGDKVRIWKSTFLFDKDSDHKSKMLHAENITMHPIWTKVKRGETIHFTLMFASLPKSCKRFYLSEVIPQTGGFLSHVMQRNKTDVYHFEIG